MDAPPRSRSRGVRPTVEALDALKQALGERQTKEGERRLTWHARAEYLGMSVPTAQRLFKGVVVDRETIEGAFRCLGLAWVPELYLEEQADVDQDADEQVTTGKERAGDGSEIVTPMSQALEEGSDTDFVSANPNEPIPSAKRSSHWTLLALSAFALAACGWVAHSARERASLVASDHEFGVVFEEGLAKFHSSKYLAAHASLEQAYEFASTRNSAKQLANCERLAGDLSGAEGDLEESKRHFQFSLQLEETVHNDAAKPSLYEAIGDVDTRLGRYADARAILNRSLEGYRQLGDSTGVSLASRDLGTVALRVGDLAGAERWFDLSLSALEGHPKPDIATDVRGRRAMVLLKRGSHGQARADLEGCLRYWTAKRHERWIAVCRLHLGEAEAALGNAGRAKALWRESRTGFERVGDQAGEKSAADLLNGLKT